MVMNSWYFKSCESVRVDEDELFCFVGEKQDRILGVRSVHIRVLKEEDAHDVPPKGRNINHPEFL
jgi:hypothetical protein